MEHTPALGRVLHKEVLLFVLSCSVMSDSLGAHGLHPTGLLCPWDSPGKNSRVGCHFFRQGLLGPGIEPTSPALEARFFTTEPPGK